ncbi:MAG: hypothetical protein AB7I50_13740 [Vicinamibacterales bacterium]
MTLRFDDYRHLVRLATLFVLGVASFLLIRAWFMPPSFGVYGHYRANALDDVRSQVVTYAGQTTCVECHTDVQELRAGGRHARLSCEGCHGPRAAHAADPTAGAPSRPDGRALCVRCHTQNAARPKTLPQVVVSDHAPEGVCTECHQPHMPGFS